MSDTPLDADGKPTDHRPWQFSIRTYFVAAVVVSVYLGAATSLTDWSLFLTLAAVTWLVWGALLFRFRTVGPLIGLLAGPPFLMAWWVPYLTLVTTSEIRHLGPLFAIIAGSAFCWGIVVSTFVALALGIARLTRRKARAPEAANGRTVGGKRLVLIVVAMRVALSAVVAPVVVAGRWDLSGITYATNFILDMPYVPIFMENVTEPRTPAGAIWFVVSTGIFGVLLYTVVGTAVAAGIARVRRRAQRIRG